MAKYKTAREWYSSREHLSSEKSWEEYKSKSRKPTRTVLNRRSGQRQRAINHGLTGIPKGMQLPRGWF